MDAPPALGCAPITLGNNAMNHVIGRRATLLGAPILLAGPRIAQAQSWPARQVRIVVGFAPGGANDIMARLIAGPPP